MDKNMKKVSAENIMIYQQLQKLEHINVIKILSCEEKDGHFIVEEEVFESRTMEEVLQEEEITGDIFYDWILQICDALEYLHTKKPLITGVSLRPSDILIGEGNVLKLIDFSEVTDKPSKEEAQSQNIAAIIALMKTVEGKFMKKYASLIQDWESDNETPTLSGFRKEIIEAYSSRVGIKRSVWVIAIMTILALFRLMRRMF